MQVGRGASWGRSPPPPLQTWQKRCYSPCTGGGSSKASKAVSEVIPRMKKAMWGLSQALLGPPGAPLGPPAMPAGAERERGFCLATATAGRRPVRTLLITSSDSRDNSRQPDAPGCVLRPMRCSLGGGARWVTVHRQSFLIPASVDRDLLSGLRRERGANPSASN
jgi:hypothetical protein